MCERSGKENACVSKLLPMTLSGGPCEKLLNPPLPPFFVILMFSNLPFLLLNLREILLLTFVLGLIDATLFVKENPIEEVTAFIPINSLDIKFLDMFET